MTVTCALLDICTVTYMVASVMVCSHVQGTEQYRARD